MTARPGGNRSGPSGPTIAREQRKRRGVEVTLSDGAREALTTIARDWSTSGSGAVEHLVAVEWAHRTGQDPLDVLREWRGGLEVVQTGAGVAIRSATRRAARG